MSPKPGLPETGTQATVEGRLERVDVAPWAFDGDAVATVMTATGKVDVHLPARWNLCKAPPVDGLPEWRPGERVRAFGRVDAPGRITVCERAEDRFVRLR